MIFRFLCGVGTGSKCDSAEDMPVAGLVDDTGHVLTPIALSYEYTP
jgi:hypothetical protein